ncbi:MAG: hypothetical protein R6U21_03405 [Thermoplasmatota archaeon]
MSRLTLPKASIFFVSTIFVALLSFFGLLILPLFVSALLFDAVFIKI